MGRLEAKAYNLRAMVQVLDERGWRSTVYAALSPAAKALMDDPPPASAWLDGLVACEVPSAVLKLYGRAAAHDFTVESTQRGAGRFLRPIVEGALRLFGATPLTLLTRIDTMAKQAARGVEIRYEPTGPRSGRATVAVDDPRPIPEAYWLGIVVALETCCMMTGETGTVDGPTFPSPRDASTAAFTLRW